MAKQHCTEMVNVLNASSGKMVEFRIVSLSPGTAAARLLAFLPDIQAWQVGLLAIKLSCRELVMTSITDEQWDNFAFIISDNPGLANLCRRSTPMVLDKHTGFFDCRGRRENPAHPDRYRISLPPGQPRH